MKKQDITQAVLFAFELEKTVDRIYSKHLYDLQIKTRQKQAIKVQYLISENGRHILQLFGYHLAQKLRDRTFYDMGKTFNQVLLSQEVLIKFCRTIWPDLGKYQLVIPPLFRILKTKQGFVRLRQMDSFVQVCKKQITPFIVEIKQHVQPYNLSIFIQKLDQESQKEDLTNSGFIQKIILEEFFKKQLKRPNPQWPKQLYNPNNPNQINYKLLLGPKFLRTGQEIKKYLLSKFVQKIIRALKRAAKSSSPKKQKKIPKKKTGRPIKPEQKKNINQKLITKYIQTNKPKKPQQNNRNQFFVKGLIQELIYSVVQWKQNSNLGQSNRDKKLARSVYVTQPQFPEIQYDLPKSQIKKIKFVGNNGLGMFVSGDKGYIMDNIKSIKKSQFQLNLSSLFKKSPIIQYQILDNILYLLKQNGLLYSWPITGDTFLHQIQTSFKKPSTPPDAGYCNFLKIKDGIIAINCTHSIYSRIELYTLNLSFIGIVELNQAHFGITYKICEQAYCLQKNIKKIPLDKQISSLPEYKQLIRNQIPETNLFMGNMLCSTYNNTLNISKITQYVNWVLGFKRYNQLILPEIIMKKLKTDKNDKELISYLLKLGYINEVKSDQVVKFMKLSCLKQGNINRKVQLICLFEDANLQPIKHTFLSNQQFHNWIAPACLMDLQLKQLTQSLQFTPDGKIDMSKLFYNQHYRRLVDLRYNRFIPGRYKCQQTPPVCVKQFLHIPNTQIILFTLCFPLQPSFYVVNMLTGTTLHTYDLSKYTPLVPLISTCQKNGYIFIVANRSIFLWNQIQISDTKPLQPIKFWQNLEQNVIIDLIVLYEQSTIITLTKDCIKIWDFEEMCKRKQTNNIFQIKPGYKAKQLQTKLSGYAKSYKRKILVREIATSLFYFIAPNQLIVAGVVSRTKSEKYYIKSFAVNKFKVIINNQKQHYQIPTKLLRQLQMTAQKRKNLPPVNKDKWLNQCQKQMQTRIMLQFQNKLKQVNQIEAKPSLKPELQQKIGLLSHSISSIYNKNMFKDNQQVHRIQNIFKIITVLNVHQLSEILQPRFLQLYKFQNNNEYEISQMLQDCMSTKQKKAVNRSLYVLSLIEKYTRPLVQAGSRIGKFISSDRNKLDQKYILSLFPTELPLDSRIITRVVNLINSLPTPLLTATKIIQNYLPTRYRFLVPRYIKQIYSLKQSTQFNEYISNRYQSQPTKQQIQLKFNRQRAYSGIQQFLFSKNLVKYAQQQVAYIFPLALNCNYSLIQALMCLKVISEDEAFYFCVRESLYSEQRLSSKIDVSNKPKNEEYLQQISQQIQKNIQNKKISIPYPKVSYSYFKDKLYSGQNCQYFFYGYLNGDRKSQQVISQNIETLLKIVKKKISLRYRISQWQWIMGQKIKILKPHFNSILQRFPLDFRIVSVTDLRTAFINLIDQQFIYDDLIKRVAYSCTSSKQKLDLWRKTEGNNLQTEGMWVNINYLLKFIEQYNPLLLELDTSSNTLNNYKIQIPACHMINRLAGDFILLSLSKFRQLLTLNLAPLSLTNVNQIISKYFKYGTNKINLFDIQHLMPKDYSIIGRFLIDKYHRLDFQHRFTVINDKVSSSQIVQLLNSKILANYLFGDQIKGLPQFLPFQEVIMPLTDQILGPAAQKISQAFALALHSQILNLIQYNISQTASMPALALSQLIHSNHHEHPILVCLLKFMTNQSSSAQVINLSALLTYLKKMKNEDKQLKYQRYYQKLRQKSKGRNIIQILIQQAQPQNLPFTIQDQPKTYIITEQHMRQISNEKYQWYINFKPYATIKQTIDHIRKVERQKQQLNKAIQLFTESCVCRVGINQIMLNIGENSTFPQFYYRLKTNYKVMSKVETKIVLAFYQAIVNTSQNKKCDSNGMRNLCQLHIPVNKKAEWICALYDRELLQNTLQNEQKVLDCELKIEKLKNLYDSKNQKTKQIEKNIIKSTLNYPKYLINKYLSNDPTKIKQLIQCIRQKKLDEARTMLQVYGVSDSIHLQKLLKYFTQQNINIENSKFIGAQDITLQQIKSVITLIKQKNKLLNYPIITSTTGQQNQFEKLSLTISNTKVYHQFMDNGMGQYYCTFHSLLVFCQSLVHNKISTSSNILKIQSEIRNFLIRMDMTHFKLYELLDLSSFENIVKYLPEVVLKGIQSQDQVQDIKNTISQLAKPERTNIKYPINSSDFKKLLSDLNIQSQKQGKQYQYLYSELDILGTGYVNINDLPKYRGTFPSYLSPYVYIPSYIEQISQKDKSDSHSLPSKYNGPILDSPQDKQLRQKIKQKLLRYQLPVRKNQKTKLIKPDVCLAIMGQFGIAQNHQYQQFIKQKFTMMSNNLLDLSGIIDWLMQSLDEQDQNLQQKNKKQNLDQRFVKVSKIVQLCQENGGLYAYLNQIKTEQPKMLQAFYQNIIEISEKQYEKQIEILQSKTSPKQQKLQTAEYLLKRIAQMYFRQIKKWDTFNNHFCAQIKNMAQMYYSLVFKFFYAHRNIDMHRIYSNISENGELTLLTLWRYVQDKGITGYSRADINQLFSAIDINSDLRLSYLQLCQFWMACEQLFPRQYKQKYETKTKIQEINNQAKNLFLQLCCVQLQNYYQEYLNLDDLVKFTNIPNVEKVDYIVRAVNSASVARGPVSGAFDCKIQMSKSKLKILVDKMKINLANNFQNLRSDLIFYATEPELHPYIKQNYTIQNLSKIILMKYPKLGYQIIQHFYDLCQFNPVILAQRYNQINNDSSNLQVINRKNMFQIMQQLVSNIQQTYRKHPFRISSYQHKYYGTSIAYGLMAEKTINQIQSLSKQVNQISNYLNKIQLPTVPLYYQLQHLHDNMFEDTKNKIKSFQKQYLSMYSYHINLQNTSSSLYEIRKTLYSKKPIKLGNLDIDQQCIVWRQIHWKDTDLVCKSDNKVNLFQFAHLYADPQISLIPISNDHSNRFNIQGGRQYNKQFVSLVQMQTIIAQGQQHRDELIDRVMSLLKYINEKLIYCYYKYAVTGLLIIPNNLFINIKDHTDLKFDNFLTALSLNHASIKNNEQTVNYIDGIDSKYFINFKRPYPPQTQLGTHTEQIDIYMLAHIVYALFRAQLNPDDTQIPAIMQKNCQQQPLWDWSSPLNQIAANKLKQKDKTKMSQKQYNLWVLFYQCSQHDWFMRPRLYQLQQVLQDYFSLGKLYNNLFQIQSPIEKLFSLLQNNRINDAKELISNLSTQNWGLPQISDYQLILKNLLELDVIFVQNYNSVLQSYAKSDHKDENPQKTLQFLSIVVDYLLMIPANKGGLCFLVNTAFKNILNQPFIKRYLGWCDMNWKIQQYQINKKIQKINMSDKLEALHKNSSFYHDISTLAECRVTLAQGQSGKRSQTSKKVAFSFIYSCLVSNNINKIYAVYKSEILSRIYCYFGRQQLQSSILAIFQITTSCLNPTLSINRFKAVDQIYKVMMIISNSIKGNDLNTSSFSIKSNNTKPKLNQPARSIRHQSQIKSDKVIQNQSIVSMQDFVNNYYMINGQQCKQAVLYRICSDQLCTLPVFTYLLHEIQTPKLQKIILNLSYNHQFQKMLRSPVVGGYLNKLKQNKMQQLSNQIKQSITLHTECIYLSQLSTSPIEQSTYCNLLKQHLKYYTWYCQLIRKQNIHEILTVNNQKNFYNYFQSFIAKSQKIYDIQINYVQSNQTSLQIIRLIIKSHRVMFDLWTQFPCHPDFTAATLRFLMKVLQAIYTDNNIYIKSKINSEVGPDILYILRKFWTEQKTPNKHDLIQIAISNGFIQFYCRIVKKQHMSMQKYIQKNVENIHMTDNYKPQAEFRLICFYLFLQNKLHAQQICQNLIAYQYTSYVTDYMLHSNLTLDLRFYKANDQVVPFRYCHPLRAEAIAMIGYTLTTKQCQLSDDIASRLIPHLAAQIKFIDCDNFESLPQKMKWIQSLWLLANIINTQNQRLKYEFINLKIHQGISNQIDKYPFLNNFFPQMTQTLRNSRSLINSLARSQIIKQI